MSLLTLWGYTLTKDDVTELPALLSVDAFNAMTNGRFTGDGRIPAALAAAQNAVRNYVGWHLAPSMGCEFQADSVDTGRIVQLPSRYVTSVESVTVNGQLLQPWDYALKPFGLLYLLRRPVRSGWNDITVRYTAGLAEVPGEVASLIVSLASHALSTRYGVQSETAGGVSISYNATWMNAGATALPSNERDTLAPYKLQGVF